jgi:glutaredoxin
MSSDPVPPAPDGPSSGAVPELVVYWRPGCPFCSSLRRALRKAGVATTEIDIWQDPSAAAAVRATTGGDETVPTVRLGDTVKVNPAPKTVVAWALANGVATTEPPVPWWRRGHPRRRPGS